MNTYNINNENNNLVIYTIFFNDGSSILYNNIIYNFFNVSREDAIKHMQKIANLGNGLYMEEKSFYGLNNAFQKIANAINPQFGLKIKK